MMTPEEFAAKQAKELAAFQAEQRIARIISDAGLPIPNYIGGKVHGALSLHYHNNSHKPRPMREAIDLFERFPLIVPAHVMRAGCTMVHPEKDLPEREAKQGYKRETGARNSGSYAARLRVSHIKGSQTRAEIEFFARVGGVLFTVSVDFGSEYIGNCSKLAPEVVENRNRMNRLESRVFNANRIAHVHADSLLTFASGDLGPIKESADHRYLFSADHDDGEDVAPADCEHAVSAMRAIADAIGE